ncbi:MAG: protein-disulfide reductase DsbD domain-containing protein [Sediminibacterium sp.]
MKKIITLFSVIWITATAVAQIQDPVDWSYSVKKVSADTYTFTATANIDGDWHIYSQTTGKGGPVPTKINFNKNPLITIVGATKETGQVKQVYDELFKTTVRFIGETATYTQTIKVRGGVKTNISGFVAYMVCDDRQCLPPSKKTFDLKLQ